MAENAVQPIPIGAWDKTFTIPTVRLFLTDAVKRRTSLATRSRSSSGVTALRGRALMYAPNPFISGSSVSHFDRTMFKNQILEPNISHDLGQSVIPPDDLTFRLFQNIGW